MNDNDLTPHYSDPWDRGSYRTGSVEVPKRRSGLVALLLILVVVLMGIVVILSAVNVKLFAQLNGQQDGDMSLSIQPTDRADTPSLPEVTTSQEKETIIQLQKPPAEAENFSQDSSLSLQQIYSQCIDSVVSITCHNGSSDSSGTGVVISQDGYIVTNCHVVEDAQQILVQLDDQRQLIASLVGADAASDLAVIHVDATDLTAAVFGDSDSLQVGDAVCAIGDPLGVELRGTMTDGIISAINRDITTGGRTMTLIQTNAALNAGNSGGPLINSYGQVIGINTMKIGDYMNVNGVEGLGFAIPSTTVKSVVDQLILQGYVSGRPFLGITGEQVSEVHRYYYGLPEGLFITEIMAGSDAQSKGLMEGDILISLDGVKITDPEQLTQLLYGYEVGDTIQVVIFRRDRQYTVELTIEEAKG